MDIHPQSRLLVGPGCRDHTLPTPMISRTGDRATCAQ